MSATRIRITAVALLLLAGVARADDPPPDRFHVRLSLTGLYATEQQDASPAEASQAAPYQLGFGELRGVVSGPLPGSLDIHLDGRVRLTGGFSTDTATVGGDQVTARGYLGGSEYEVRQAWLRWRGERVDASLGRLLIPEADALRIDGTRVGLRLGHVEVSAFGGSLPDPFSRSVTTDYTSAPAFAGGAAVAWRFDRIWGSISGVGLWLGGLDDGGPFDPTQPAGTPTTEGARGYLTWTGFERPFAWLDLFHDLVVDVGGPTRAELRRLDALANVRLGSHVALHLAYDHLSPWAIEMYLARMLASRPDFLVGTIENNLTVERTARDQGRVAIDATAGTFTAFAEGRLRRRSLVDPSSNPQFLVDGSDAAPSVAWDATVGLRDRGALLGLRPSLFYTYLDDMRARSHIVAASLARSFLDERLEFEGQFLWAATRDDGTGQPCDPTTPTAQLTSCFGDRDGNEYEAGMTITASPSDHWLLYADYRVVIDTTPGTPAILTHVALLRVEARY